MPGLMRNAGGQAAKRAVGAKKKKPSNTQRIAKAFKANKMKNGLAKPVKAKPVRKPTKRGY